MSVRSRAVAVLGSVAAALALGTLPASAAPAPASTTDPAAAAAGWLAQQFVGADHRPSPSGDRLEGSFGSPPSYYFDGGRTADAIYALAAAGAGKARIDAAIGYFAAHVAEYTSITDTTGKPGPYDGQIGKTALAAIVAGADPTSFGGHDLLQALKDDECTEVSAPADQNDFSTPVCPAVGAARNIYSSISESFVVLASARGATLHGAQYAPSAAAVDYFLSLQCPGGGFTGLTTACTKDSDATTDATAYAAFALAALGGHQPQLDRAVSFLQGGRAAGGYWVAEGGPDVDSTGLATAALAAAGRDVGASRAWLVSQQVTDGPTVGPGASRGALKYQGAFDAFSSVKGTADGLLGLVPDGSLATITAAGAASGTRVLALAGPTLGSASVAQGARQSVTGTGFAAGERVAAVVHSTPAQVGTASANAAGTVTLTFTVPATLATGTHRLVLTGATSGLSSAASFSVTAAPAAAPVPVPPAAAPQSGAGAPLAATGLDGPRLLVLGLAGGAMLAAGAALSVAGRRRRA